MIDTHLHIIDRAAINYPWLASTPPLNRDFLWDEYHREAARGGIDQAMFMEVDADPAQNFAEIRLVQKIANAHDPKRGQPILTAAIMAAFPESPRFAEEISQYQANPLLRGLRRVLHVMPTETLRDMLRSEMFRRNIRALTGTGLSFDLVIPIEAATLVAAVIDQAPDVTFILDHAGRPNIDLNRLPDNRAAWRDGIKRLAACPNLMVKISGLVDRADLGGWGVNDLRPIFETVIEQFGWQRVVWGSDWPVCTLAGGLKPWVEASRALVAECSPAEQLALFRRNAQRIYRL